MYKYILERAGDINWMAVFSLLTFFFLFTTAVVLVFRRDKEHLDHMSNMPLQEDSIASQNQNQ